MAQDDGSVHDVPRGQHHRVGHKCIHQRVCKNKVNDTFRIENTMETKSFNGCVCHYILFEYLIRQTDRAGSSVLNSVNIMFSFEYRYTVHLSNLRIFSFP